MPLYSSPLSPLLLHRGSEREIHERLEVEASLTASELLPSPAIRHHQFLPFPAFEMYKNQLQELSQRSCFNLPSYTCFQFPLHPWPLTLPCC